MQDRTRARPGAASNWLFSAGRVAFYFRTAGFFKTDQWLFCTGLCSKWAGLVAGSAERSRTGGSACWADGDGSPLARPTVRSSRRMLAAPDSLLLRTKPSAWLHRILRRPSS